MGNPGLAADLLSQNLHFNKLPLGFMDTLKFERHPARTAGLICLCFFQVQEKHDNNDNE